MNDDIKYPLKIFLRDCAMETKTSFLFLYLCMCTYIWGFGPSTRLAKARLLRTLFFCWMDA